MNATDLPSKANCHKGNSVLWTSAAGGKLTVGGSSRGVVHMGLMVDLTNGSNAPLSQGVAGNKEGKALARNLMALSQPSLPYLNLPIRDFGVPTWTTKTLKALALDVRDVLKSGMDVTIACTGGHGRSGMIAAILLQLLDPVKDEHPVTRLRRLHCLNAIETEEQVRYVCDCTGFPFDQELVIERPKSTAVTVTTNKYDDVWSKYVTNRPTGARPEPLVKRRNGKGKEITLTRCAVCSEYFDPATGEVANDPYEYPDFSIGDPAYPICGGCLDWAQQEADIRGRHPTEKAPF